MSIWTCVLLQSKCCENATKDLAKGLDTTMYIYIYVDNVIIFMLGCCAFIAEIAVASPLNHKIGILSVNRNVMRVSRGK